VTIDRSHTRRVDDAIAHAERDVDAGVNDAPRKRRRRRRTRPRSKTISPRALKTSVHAGRVLTGAGVLPSIDDYAEQRPKKRSDCVGAMRPCPWVGCKYHLYIDVNPETGALRLNFPDLEPWELQHSCALDVADRGGITLEEVGETTNLTRERIRQIEVKGLIRLKGAGVLRAAFDDE
jgi:hypothetical protein